MCIARLSLSQPALTAEGPVQDARRLEPRTVSRQVWLQAVQSVKLCSPDKHLGPIWLQSVPSQRPMTAMGILDNGRRRISAAWQAVPKFGGGAQGAKGQSVPSHPPAAKSPQKRPAPQCGICLEDLKDPACGPCG